MADSTRSPGQASNKHCNGQGGNKDFTSSGRSVKSTPVRSKSSICTSLNKMSPCDLDKDVSSSSPTCASTSPSHLPSSSCSLIMKLVKERDQLVLQAVNLYLQSNPNQSNVADLFSPSISNTNSSRDVSISSPVQGNDESMSSSTCVLPVTSVTSSQAACPNVTLSPSNVQLNDADKQMLPDSVLTSSSSSPSSPSKSSCSAGTSSCSSVSYSSSLTTQQVHPHSPITPLTSDSVLLNEDQVRQRIEKLKVELEENDEAIIAATATCVSSATTDETSSNFQCSNCISSIANRECDAEHIHELKGKMRNLQLENEEKNELISELRELLEKNNENLTKIQSENSDLQSQTRRCKVLEDEIDILNEKVRLVDRLESEVLKYREKVNELDFYKTRLDEIREENKLLHDAKIILQDQLETFRSKSDKIPDLESQIIHLTALNNELKEQQSINKEKISCLMDELNSCRIEKKTIVDDLAQVQTELTHLRCVLNKNTNGSNLREQLNSDATKRFLKLELEHQKLLSSVDCIRNSELINNTATSVASTSTSTATACQTNCTDVKSSTSNTVKAVSPTASSCSSSASSYPFSSSSSACSNKRYSIDCTNGPMVNVKHYLSTAGSTVDSLDDIDDADHLHNNFTAETLLYETDSGCVSLVGELNHRLEKIERENYQIKLSMDTIKESEGKLTKLRDENYSLQSQVTTLKGQLELAKLKLDSSEVNSANVKEDNQKLSKRINELSDEIDQLRKEKLILAKEKEKLEDNLKLTQDKLLSFSRSTLHMRNNNPQVNGKIISNGDTDVDELNDKNCNLPKSLNGLFNSVAASPRTPGASFATSNGNTPTVVSSNFNRGTFKSSSVNFNRLTTRDNSPRLINAAAQRATLFTQHSSPASCSSTPGQSQQQQQQPQFCLANQTSIHLHHHHQYISNSITASTSITNSSPCQLSSNVINGSNIFLGSPRSGNLSSNNVIDAHHAHHHQQQQQQRQQHQYHQFYQHQRSNSNIILSANNNGNNIIVNNTSCPPDTNVSSSTLSVTSPTHLTATADHVHGHYLRVYHATHTTIGGNSNGVSSSSPVASNGPGNNSNNHLRNGHLSSSSSSSSPATAGAGAAAISMKLINSCHQSNSKSIHSISSSDYKDDLLLFNSMTPATKISSTSDASKIAVQNTTSNKNNMNNVTSASNNSSTGSNVISSFVAAAASSTCTSSNNAASSSSSSSNDQQRQHNSSLVNSIHGKHLHLMSPLCHDGKNQQSLHEAQLVHQHVHHHTNLPLNHHHIHHSTRSVSPNSSSDSSSVWFEYGCV